MISHAGNAVEFEIGICATSRPGDTTKTSLTII